MTVLLLPGDSCQVGKTPLKMSDLPLALRVLAGLPEKPLITIEADKQVLFGRVVEAVDACHEAGLEEVAFVVTPAKEGR